MRSSSRPGILQPPAFNMQATDAVNYGAIGVVIGHEISHGFDDQGAQYDAEGRLKNWWTDDDLKKFQAKTQCVVDQFDGYYIEPNHPSQRQAGAGRVHRRPGGVKIAYLAFKKSQAGRPPRRPSTASPRTSSSSSPGDSSAATRLVRRCSA